MKKIARITSLFLALIMVVALLASCGGETNPGTPGQSGTDTTKAPETTAAPDAEVRIDPNLPDVRYDGYTYRIRVKGEATNWSTIGIWADTKTGEPINDATLERNNAIKDKYGVDIVTIEGADIANSVNQMVLSQLDEIDLVIAPVNSIASMAPKSVYDLKQLKYLDLEKPWYDQNFNKEVSIGGRLYAVTGDLVLNDDNGTWCTLFNKRIAEDYEVENLYKLVESGGWTLDKAYEIAKPVTVELTGDDIRNYDDQWGFVTEVYNAYAMVASTGEKIASKDENDMPYLTANTEKFQNVLTKAVDILGDNSVVALTQDWSGDTNYVNPFKVGRGLFVIAGLYDLGQVREVDDEIGVLPMPKYEESQEVSLNPITVYNFTMCLIPITVGDADRTAILTEAMFAESRYTTRVAFYETTLKKKYMPDEESKRILDTVIENRTYDLGAIYGWGGIVTRLNSLMQTRSSNFSSTWKSLERVAKKAMETTMKDFEKAENAG